ncbi:hypothetical protein [Rhizobium sp. 1399]|uniref:hypothetical protein n=1 Tax=Rhizobium sp. 1399 TaxID=2817758 RepID=UPI002854A98E|nr:hypothetical protein [Rhizobium sp. 1399]MDR6669982.1 hypothetical protein [Rhizobium sp. 1399]
MVASSFIMPGEATAGSKFPYGSVMAALWICAASVEGDSAEKVSHALVRFWRKAGLNDATKVSGIRWRIPHLSTSLLVEGEGRVEALALFP